jgi:hypothetical protein
VTSVGDDWHRGIGGSDAREAERDDPSIAGKPEVPAFGDEGALEREPGENQTGPLEERERRQQVVQQHGDTVAVDSDEPTDHERHPAWRSNRLTALPGDRPEGERAT